MGPTMSERQPGLQCTDLEDLGKDVQKHIDVPRPAPTKQALKERHQQDVPLRTPYQLRG